MNDMLFRRLSTAYKKDAAAKAPSSSMIVLPRRPQPVKSFLCFDVSQVMLLYRRAQKHTE